MCRLSSELFTVYGNEWVAVATERVSGLTERLFLVVTGTLPEECSFHYVVDPSRIRDQVGPAYGLP